MVFHDHQYFISWESVCILMVQEIAVITVSVPHTLFTVSICMQLLFQQHQYDGYD